MVDPDRYPGSNHFVNKLGITDPKFFLEVEWTETTVRTTELLAHPDSICPKSDGYGFDLTYLRAIHRHLFQNIYTWAGEIRSYDMRIEFRDIFTSPDKIDFYFQTIVAQEIREDGYLVGKKRDFVVKKLARYLGLINSIHPFPDGNGRSQRPFIVLLARKAGFDINWTSIPKWQHRVAAQNAHRYQDYSALETLIDTALSD